MHYEFRANTLKHAHNYFHYLCIFFGKKIGLQRLPACKASYLYGLMENELLKAMI